MSHIKELLNGCIAEGYILTTDGVLMSPEHVHTSQSPILAQDERSEMQGRGWINHLKEANMSITHSTKVKVYGFEGRVRYGKPGLVFEPAKTHENFGEWRNTKSQDGKKIADWLVKNGYRLVWRKLSGSGENRKYVEYWALRSLPWVGNDARRIEIGPHELRQRIQEDEETKDIDGLAAWAKALIGA